MAKSSASKKHQHAQYVSRAQRTQKSRQGLDNSDAVSARSGISRRSARIAKAAAAVDTTSQRSTARSNNAKNQQKQSIQGTMDQYNFDDDFESINNSQDQQQDDGFKVPDLPKNFHQRKKKQTMAKQVLQKNSSSRQDNRKNEQICKVNDRAGEGPLKLMKHSKSLFSKHIVSNHHQAAKNSWMNAYKTPQIIKDEDLSTSLRMALSPPELPATSGGPNIPLSKLHSILQQHIPKSATTQKNRQNSVLGGLGKNKDKGNIYDQFNQDSPSLSLNNFLQPHMQMKRNASYQPDPFDQVNTLQRASSLMQYGQTFQNFLNQNQHLFFGQTLNENSIEPIKHIKHNQLDSILQHISTINGQQTGRSSLIRNSPNIRPFVCKDMIHENLLKSIDEMDDAQILNFIRKKYTQQQQQSMKQQKQSSEDSIMLPGMTNLGNTCFANSVLQCLFHTKYIQAYCAQSFHSKCCNSLIKNVAEGQLSQLFQGLYNDSARREAGGLRSSAVDNNQFGVEVNPDSSILLGTSSKGRKVQSIKENNQYCKISMQEDNFCSFCVMEQHVKSAIRQRDFNVKSILPLSVIILINKISDQFKIGQQSDAQEFMLILLENLIQSSFGYHQNVEYKMQSQSFIPKVFQGMIERQIICCSCNHIRTIQEVFLDLSLNLSSGAQIPIAHQGMPAMAGRANRTSRGIESLKSYEHVELYDCLSEFFKTDTLDSQNKLLCENCETSSIAQMRFRLKQLPRILIVHIKRFSWTGSKLRNPFNFDEEIQIDAEYINLSQQKYSTDEEVSRELNHVYRLYALIVHEGNSTTQGHYYAYIKNSQNRHWYRYDDSAVTKIGQDLNNVKKNTQNVYILFYQKHYIEESVDDNSSNDRSQSNVIQSIKRSRKPSFYRQQCELGQVNSKDSEGFDLFEKLKPTDEKLLSAQFTQDKKQESSCTSEMTAKKLTLDSKVIVNQNRNHNKNNNSKPLPIKPQLTHSKTKHKSSDPIQPIQNTQKHEIKTKNVNSKQKEIMIKNTKDKKQENALFNISNEPFADYPKGKPEFYPQQIQTRSVNKKSNQSTKVGTPVQSKTSTTFSVGVKTHHSKILQKLEKSVNQLKSQLLNNNSKKIGKSRNATYRRRR